MLICDGNSEIGELQIVQGVITLSNNSWYILQSLGGKGDFIGVAVTVARANIQRNEYLYSLKLWMASFFPDAIIKVLLE